MPDAEDIGLDGPAIFEVVHNSVDVLTNVHGEPYITARSAQPNVLKLQTVNPVHDPEDVVADDAASRRCNEGLKARGLPSRGHNVVSLVKDEVGGRPARREGSRGSGSCHGTGSYVPRAR